MLEQPDRRRSRSIRRVDEPAIEVRDLRMRYGSTDVLTGVTFTARPGEVLALLGPNGAGKTTTIEILEGFRMRSAGDVRVLGVDPARGDERWRARLGVVLQSWRDHGKWRVRELLDHLGCVLRRRTPRRRSAGRGTSTTSSTPVGLTAHADKRIAPALRRAAPPARRRDRHRRPARAALPRRADRRLRPAGPARVPRPGAPPGRPASTPRSCSPPTTWTRPRSSPTGSSSWPAAGSSPTARPTQLARQMSDGGRGALEPATASGSCTPPRTPPVRPGAVPAVRRRRRRPRGPPGHPGGHLHGPGPRVRVRPQRAAVRAFEEVTR